MKRQIVNYIGEKKHRKGLQRMTGKGWRAESTVASVPKRGCLSTLLFGWIFRKATVFVVTYVRD